MLMCACVRSEFTVHSRMHNVMRSQEETAAAAAGAGGAQCSCSFCGKVLSSQSSLDRHMLVHSGASRLRFQPLHFQPLHSNFTSVHIHSILHVG